VIYYYNITLDLPSVNIKPGPRSSWSSH